MMPYDVWMKYLDSNSIHTKYYVTIQKPTRSVHERELNVTSFVVNLKRSCFVVMN